MITRAQAEALLTLAESLEACERLGATFRQGPCCQWLDIGKVRNPLGGGVNAMSIRLAVNALIPKQKD